MNSLFSSAGLEGDAPHPLANQMRPRALDDVVGQDHLLKPDQPLGRMLAQKRLASLIFWGPPGVGKTTIARLLAEETQLRFEAISAVFSGVKELRDVFTRAEEHRATGQGTLLFVDEIHRFNRAQQDGFLPVVESGIVTLVGATTENPSFELNAALLSRCQVMVLHRLDAQALETLLTRAEALSGQTLPLTQDARIALCAMADGDGRYLLNMAEELLTDTLASPLDPASLSAHLLKRAPAYDKNREEHYNLISALHKSVRSSDPDASLYWLCRMLKGGEDPLYIARRLIRIASEDVGLADPSALLVCDAAARTYERLGTPEGELALAHATIHLATAPKSIAAYRAFNSATKSAAQTGSLRPPQNILNAPTKLMKDLGYGKDYEYDPNLEDGVSAQALFPDEMEPERFYNPKGEGREAAIRARLDEWHKRREAKQKE